MKTGHRKANILQGYYKASKNVAPQYSYRGGNTKNTSRKLQFDSKDSPSKFNLKVVESIQHKRIKVQESGNEEIPVITKCDKTSKYKGKRRYNRELPRHKVNRADYIAQAQQKKRLVKREDKEMNDMKDRTALYQKYPNSKQQSFVSFENLNSKESLVSRKRTRGVRMLESSVNRPGKKVSSPIPPKSLAQKELDREWVQDLPQGLSKKQKEHLLSLEDQAERNRELSRMTDSGEGSQRNPKSSLAVLRLRKSHLLNKTKNQSNKNSDYGRKLDEIHYENFVKNQRKHTNKNSEDNYQRRQQVSKKVSPLEIVSRIRARGEKARQQSIHNTPKSTPKQRSSHKSPLNKDKLSPVPFPSFDSDKKEIEKYSEIASSVAQDDMEVESQPPVIEKDIFNPLKIEEKGIKKLEPETKPMEVVDKVQNQAKDVSVPLVTEIIRQPLRDSSYEMMSHAPPRQMNKMTPTPIGKGKQIIESIKVQHGNLRSPAKINNRMLISSEEPSLQPLLDTDSEFKTPLPKKPRSASKKDSRKTKEFITTFPMRIDFNERPKEYDEIILPKKLQLVFDFFVELDNAINNCKRRGKIPILSNLKPFIEQSTNRSFDIDHFKKVYYVSPELYYYSWQPSQGNSSHELRIEIPENIEEIITKVHKKSIAVELIRNPLSEPMTNFLSNKRKIIMRTRLILYIENLHKNFLNQNKLSSLEFNAVKGWHPNFDLESVMDLQRKTLKNAPKSKKGETITEFLKNKNIKNALLKRENESMKSEIHHSAQTTNSSLAYPSPEKRSPAKINNSMISPSFYRRIENKERIYKEEKKNLERESKKEEYKRKQELMLKIAMAVKNVFSVQKKVSTLFLNNVLKYLNDKQRGNFYSKKELINTLKEISEIVPEWLTLKKHDRGFLVKI